MCYNKKGSRKICKRLRFLASESSIHALRLFAITISNRVAYVELQKNEDTWYEVLGDFRSRILYSPESIRRTVAWKAFHIFVLNRNDNLNVPYLYENGDEVKLNWNWLDNNFNSNNPALRFPKFSLFFLFRFFIGRVFLCQNASTPTSQISTN
ncbi:MAG: hypothetical protein US27_C0022G0015 [Candidatus Moranbacteria bacterium GW2011_GWF1_36_78]|nr:MAG: hypothetical protein US27_C0022G0015 [Candidatus Moranbacteria bacterium GW2011_GWF1_36_78]